MPKTYLYDGQEVKKTGRQAVKKTVLRGRERVFTMIEIVSVDESFDFKRWVTAEDLYEITSSE